MLVNVGIDSIYIWHELKFIVSFALDNLRYTADCIVIAKNYSCPTVMEVTLCASLTSILSLTGIHIWHQTEIPAKTVYWFAVYIVQLWKSPIGK